MPEPEPKERLLDAAITHVATNGISDLSLRSLAAQLGTSHRMLIHHFGSKEGLWLAIVREVERRQLTLVDNMVAAGGTFEQQMWSWWRHISDPSLWPNERLFFEVYGQGLQGREPAAQLLEDVVDVWVEPAARAAVAMGLDPASARAFGRLGVAVTRGLLLDLLATEEREAVDAAMKLWISMSAGLLGASR